MSNLFRKEAIQHQQSRLHGEVILTQPRWVAFAVSAIIGIFCLLILCVVFGSYTRHETVMGQLESTQGTIRVLPASAGYVAKVSVKEGMLVKAGDPLLELSPELKHGSGQSRHDQQAALMQANIDAVKSKLAQEKSLFKNNLAQLNQRQSALKTEKSLLDDQLALSAKRLETAQNRLKQSEALAEKGHIAQVDLEQQMEATLQLAQAQSERQQRLIQLDSEMKQLAVQIDSLPKEHAKRLAELSQEQREFESRGVDYQRIGHDVLRSPVDGVVTNVEAKVGMASQNTPLVVILPLDASLQAELYVPTRAIGFVTTGQAVKIRYDAFAHQRFGNFKGTINHIGRGVLRPGEPGVPQEINTPVYKVWVTLDAQSIAAYGSTWPLQPGMTLEADIQLERLPIWQYLLDPILSLRGRL